MNQTSLAVGEPRARSSFYSCLARVFGTVPTPETFHNLHDMATRLGITGFGEVTDSALRALKREYMELFVVPNPRYVAPYESAHTNQAPLPHGRPLRQADPQASASAVRRFYRETRMLQGQDVPDHIANELSFLAYVCSKEAQAPPIEAQGWRHLRAEFRREHLLRWIGRLREIVTQRDRLGHYGVALRVCEALLRDEEHADAEARWGGARQEAMAGVVG